MGLALRCQWRHKEALWALACLHEGRKNRLGGPQKRLPHLVASPGRELVLEDVHELDRREAEVTGDGVSHRVGGGREVFVPRDVAVEVVVSTK